MLPVDFFLACRYLKPKRTFVSVITLLSILGPILGVAILLIVSSVMAGFDRDIRNGIMNMNAHLTVYPFKERYFAETADLLERLEKYGIHATPVIEAPALIQIRDQIMPKYIRGVIPERERLVTSIFDKLYAPGRELKPGQVIVGDRFSYSTGLLTGSQFLIHSPARLTAHIHWKEDGKIDFQQPDEMYLPEEVTICNYFSLGVADFDDNIIVMHLDQAAELLGLDWGSATSIQAKVPDPMNMTELVSQMRRENRDLQFVTWQEKNQMLFSTLKVEKNLMTFLMAFIVVVASFSIAATLITVVVQKTREIGVLKAVGTSSGTIARIFLLQGAIIGVLGTGLGLLLGSTILALRDQVAAVLSFLMGHEVFPAELYHLTRIPAQTTGTDLLLISVMSFAICVLAALVPAIYASALRPAKSLQEDN